MPERSLKKLIRKSAPFMVIHAAEVLYRYSCCDSAWQHLYFRFFLCTKLFWTKTQHQLFEKSKLLCDALTSLTNFSWINHTTFKFVFVFVISKTWTLNRCAIKWRWKIKLTSTLAVFQVISKISALVFCCQFHAEAFVFIQHPLSNGALKTWSLRLNKVFDTTFHLLLLFWWRCNASFTLCTRIEFLMKSDFNKSKFGPSSLETNTCSQLSKPYLFLYISVEFDVRV